MDNLQYRGIREMTSEEKLSFKPYYKWIIFNMELLEGKRYVESKGFKPYYKWIIFNIKFVNMFNLHYDKVLNLIING